MQLHVKHAGQTFDVEVAAGASGRDLKTLLAARTGVPAERQKLIARGKRVADDVELAKAQVAEGQTLMMLGTAAPPPRAPSPPPGELEEPPDEMLEKVPVGLTNIGNTCYANAVLQALRTVPELTRALEQYDGSSSLLSAWAQLLPRFGQLAPLGTDAPTPYAFLNALRQKVPQFGELGEMGVPKQQDAEELWTALFSELSEQGGARVQDAVADFTGALRVRVARAGGGDVADSREQFTKLPCHINIRTNFVRDGLLASLNEQRETAENSGAFDEVTKRIEAFPKYFTVQFVRFFWRKDTKANSKILRQVAFPLQLDLAPLATDELLARARPARDAFRALESAEEEARRQERRAKFRRLDAVAPDGAQDDAEAAEATREQQKITDLRAALAAAVAGSSTNPANSQTGVYNLQAVVTHLGMSADSGHYQCFTRNPDRPNSWWRFNDESVTEVDDNRILQLAGGGASDSALILLYKSAEL